MKKLLFILPLALCFIISCQESSVKSELEKYKSNESICELNKEIVRELLAAIDKNDFDKLHGLLNDDFSLNVPGLEQPMQKDDLDKAISTFYAAFPDWTHNIEDIIAEDDKIMVKVKMNGTHKAEYQGITATNKKITMYAAAQMTLVDGKVKDWWAIEDYLGMWQQLGMELKMKEGNK
jgi:steroid delta-isomerase-like uncharacterized protein